MSNGKESCFFSECTLPGYEGLEAYTVSRPAIFPREEVPAELLTPPQYEISIAEVRQDPSRIPCR